MCLRFTSFKRVSDRFQDTVKTQHCHVSNCKEYSSIHIQAYKRRRKEEDDEMLIINDWVFKKLTEW